jgi:outer membrane protein assembly factor BamB
MRSAVLTLWCAVLLAGPGRAEDIDRKYPLGPQLRVLAEDVRSPSYRKLVTEKMLSTDLAAEWQRVETEDNAEGFLKEHGGKAKVLADPDLKRAYERRVEIRHQFLDLMREGYKRYKQVPPFDRGEKAEPAGTFMREAAGARLPLAVVPPVPAAADHWPRFRGPSGQGWTGKKRLPVHWNKDGTNLVWRIKTPAQGNSSPIIWGERIFVTGAIAQGAERWLYCISRSDGRLLWARQAPPKPPESDVRDKNGYASATPVTDGERVIAFLGSCGLVCFDFEGTLLWHYDALPFHTTHGTGSSPVLYRDLVILVHDQNLIDSVFVALDKRTGKRVWTQARKRAMGWGTPVVVHVGDRDELVFAGGETVKGYDPNTGKELWSLAGPTHEVVPTIVVGPDLIYSASGRNGPTLGLRPGGTGDVTRTHLVWRTVRGGPHVPSPIYLADRLFTVNDTGIATCLDAVSGKLLWQARIADRFSASPIEAGGLLYFPSETGITYVLRAADKFVVAARNDLGSPILASPAVAGNHIIMRTQDELVCVGE